MGETRAEARGIAALQEVPLIGTGKLEIRITEAPKDPRLPSELEWVWAVIEMYAQDGRVVREEMKRMGLKATLAEALAEATACFEALKIERGH
jgi:hypothetical protein